ncbi:MAG: 50S ribosomal protein L31 [Anaeromyxobacteraceae bacterium]|nr:50S ribosomal protein L31 [Anaeromyxobacteraceae bacterium]
MKEGIHPDYKPAKILCACGNLIETRSVAGDFHIEICSNCHPFFTGKQKIMDTAGRIEKFKTRYGNASSATLTAAPDAKKAAPAPAPAKKAAPAENRAAKRAKASAGKPKKVEAAEAEAPAAEPKPE